MTRKGKAMAWSRRSVELLGIVIVTLLGLLPTVHYKILGGKNLFLAGNEISYLAISVVLTDILIVSSLVFRLVKFASERRSTATLLGAFSLLAFAEVIYGVGTFQKNFLFGTPIVLCFLAYTFAFFLFALYLYSIYWKTLTRSAVTGALVLIGSLLIILLMNFHFILRETVPGLPSLFLKSNAVLYAIGTGLVTSCALRLIFTESHFFRFLFLVGLLGMGASDFGLRISESRPNFQVVGFEFGWQWSITLLALAIFKEMGHPCRKITSSFQSLRSLIAWLSLVGTGLILSLLYFAKVIQVETSISVAVFILSVLSAIILSNFLGLLISRKTLSAIHLIRTRKNFEQISSRNSVETCMIPTVNEKTKIEEIDEFIEEYNTLSRYSQRILHEYASTSELAAIGRTVQMVAHDVRSPFSLMRAGLDLLEQVNSPSELKQTLGIVLPSVNQAIVSVNGMLDDIMLASRTTHLLCEPTDIATLIENSLSEIFRVTTDSEVTFSYNLRHTQKLLIDPTKISRVLLNTITNALQAMSGKGNIWFSSEDVTNSPISEIHLVIGNSGPSIAEQDLPEIFDAFFTKNKKGGTGLGLAIVKKIMTEHGGNVYCVNRPEGGVEFHFTLPSSDISIIPSSSLLPNSSLEIKKSLEQRLLPQGEEQVHSALLVQDPRERSFEGSVLVAARTRQRPVSLVIVEDELLYRDGICALVGPKTALASAVRLHPFSNTHEALNSSETFTADIIICDVDLGHNSIDGYEMTRRLRARGFRGEICIHSNRNLPEDYRDAMDAGANSFIPKPMSRSHILQLMAMAVTRTGVPEEIRATPFPFHFAVADDEAVMRLCWKSLFGKNVDTFASGAELLEVLGTPENSPWDFIITDYHLGKGQDSGLTLAKIIRIHSTSLPIFLCSNRELEPEESLVFTNVMQKSGDLEQELRRVLRESGLMSQEAKLALDTNSAEKVTLKEKTSSLPGEDIRRLRHDIRSGLLSLELLAQYLPTAGNDKLKHLASVQKKLAALAGPLPSDLISTARGHLQELEQAESRRQELLEALQHDIDALTRAHHEDTRWNDLTPHATRVAVLCEGPTATNLEIANGAQERVDEGIMETTIFNRVPVYLELENSASLDRLLSALNADDTHGILDLRSHQDSPIAPPAILYCDTLALTPESVPEGVDVLVASSPEEPTEASKRILHRASFLLRNKMR